MGYLWFHVQLRNSHTYIDLYTYSCTYGWIYVCWYYMCPYLCVGVSTNVCIWYIKQNIAIHDVHSENKWTHHVLSYFFVEESNSSDVCIYICIYVLHIFLVIWVYNPTSIRGFREHAMDYNLRKYMYIDTVISFIPISTSFFFPQTKKKKKKERKREGETNPKELSVSKNVHTELILYTNN